MKVVFDNDASSDDIIALIYLAAHPKVTLEAITVTGTGEAHGRQGAQNMADVCTLLGLAQLPIAYGRDTPLSASGKPFPAALRSAVDAILTDRDVPKNPNPNLSDNAVALIKNCIEKNDEKITLVATGPLTNIAELITHYPHLNDKIENIVVMGGAVRVPGNIQALVPESDNTSAEWNIYADPAAAEIVFSSGLPVTLVPLDATNQVPMTKEFYDSLSEQTRPELRLIYQLLTVFVGFLGMELFLSEFYLWDPLAAMICCDPEIAVMERMSLSVNPETAGTEEVCGPHKVNVAAEILNPETVLQRLIEKIKSGLRSGGEKNYSGYFFKKPADNRLGNDSAVREEKDETSGLRLE